VNGPNETGSVSIEGKFAVAIEKNGVGCTQHGSGIVNFVSGRESFKLMGNSDIYANKLQGRKPLERFGYSSRRNLKSNITSAATGFVEGVLMELRGQGMCNGATENGKARRLIGALV
tara:strand:- start:537 stop:887 length:351 start_codon:yes stop_codon:yes gene_type:complete